MPPSSDLMPPLNDGFAGLLDGWLQSSVETLLPAEDELFSRVVKPNINSIVLYGAGYMGRKALDALRTAAIEPIGISDDNPECRIEGFAVIPAEEIAVQYPHAAVFVTIPMTHRYFLETVDRLKRTGCKNVFSGAYLFHALKTPYFFIDHPRKLLHAKSEIQAAFALFTDELSRREFLTQVSTRLNVDFDAPAALSPEAQYRPGDFFSKNNDETFVDCGAFDGDTVDAFVKWQNGKFKQVLGLEPDNKNFFSLQNRVKQMPGPVREKIITLQVAVGATVGSVKFSTTGTAQAQFSTEEGANDVPLSTLDTLLVGQRATYIKMDIEGAEIQALAGARATIQKNMPVLAICVYHRQDHLWKIPLLINSIFNRYRLVLRTYMPSRLETVCYAIPEHRLMELPN